MKKKPDLQLVERTRKVVDPVALTVQILGLRWIRMEDCKPPEGMDFIGLEIKGPGDYHIQHCVFDGTGNEGLEKVMHWFPAPALPRRAVEGFPPHETDLGKKLIESLRAWARRNEYPA